MTTRRSSASLSESRAASVSHIVAALASSIRRSACTISILRSARRTSSAVQPKREARNNAVLRCRSPPVGAAGGPLVTVASGPPVASAGGLLVADVCPPTAADSWPPMAATGGRGAASKEASARASAGSRTA